MRELVGMSHRQQHRQRVLNNPTDDATKRVDYQPVEQSFASRVGA